MGLLTDSDARIRVRMDDLFEYSGSNQIISNVLQFLRRPLEETILLIKENPGMLFGWTLRDGGLSVRQLTLFFSTFVFLQFWNMFNAKGFETRHSVFTCLKGCREFFLILAAIGIGQFLIVEFGGSVFRTEPLSWKEWVEIIGLTSLLAIGGEAVRALRRR